MKTIFVTGGSGFVGRNLVRGLLERGYAVRALARSDASAGTLAAMGVEPVRGDVLNATALVSGLRGCYGVIHAAADTDLGSGNATQERVNVKGARTVFRAARETGVQRGVHVSTESVLAGGAPIVWADETWPFAAKPAGEYSRTKALAEQVALAESVDGLCVSAIRPRLVWGRDDTSTLPRLLAAAQAGRLRWINGGGYLTSTTHVANVVVAALAALERGAPGQAYFVTDGPPVPFRKFISALLATRGVAPPQGSVPRWLIKPVIRTGTWLQARTHGAVKPPLSWQEYAVAGHEVTLNDARARRELGYAPVLTLEQGLAELRSGGAWAAT